MKRKIVVLGGGFAGLWSALGAARQRAECGLSPEQMEITLVNRDGWHGIRVRNYEADPTVARVPLAPILETAQVRLIEAEITGIAAESRAVTVSVSDETQTLEYDRLVVALGSRLTRPNLPGLAEHAFDVDTYGGASRLQAHLESLPGQPETPGRFTVLVVGAGLTGIETAAEMPERLRQVYPADAPVPFRVILADAGPRIGARMGDAAQPVIAAALTELGVEMRPNSRLVFVSKSGVRLASGENIAANTVVWCGGLQAHPLTGALPVARDTSGRVPVDPYLRVVGVPDVLAAGDVARLPVDPSSGHDSVMSCQHSRPMGRFAGHNAVRDLLGLPLLPLEIDWYVTVLDLGAWGALYTGGWERKVISQGAAAKATKRIINQERIYPPLTGSQAALFAAAAPVVQAPPYLLKSTGT